LAKKLRWRGQPASGNYAAAGAYLSLLMREAEARKVVGGLGRRAAPPLVVAPWGPPPTTRQKPKDLERASGLQLLPPDDPGVQAEVKKSRQGKALAPILVLRGRLDDCRPLVIADGYHRMCASYYVNPAAEIPCRVADLT
jgi:hypothetical protein